MKDGTILSYASKVLRYKVLCDHQWALVYLRHPKSNFYPLSSILPPPPFCPWWRWWSHFIFKRHESSELSARIFAQIPQILFLILLSSIYTTRIQHASGFTNFYKYLFLSPSFMSSSSRSFSEIGKYCLLFIFQQLCAVMRLCNWITKGSFILSITIEKCISAKGKKHREELKLYRVENVFHSKRYLKKHWHEKRKKDMKFRNVHFKRRARRFLPKKTLDWCKKSKSIFYILITISSLSRCISALLLALAHKIRIEILPEKRPVLAHSMASVKFFDQAGSCGNGGFRIFDLNFGNFWNF